MTDERSVLSGTDVENQSLSGMASNPTDRCSSDVGSEYTRLLVVFLDLEIERTITACQFFHFLQMESGVRNRGAHRVLSNLELECALDGNGSVLLLFFSLFRAFHFTFESILRL